MHPIARKYFEKRAADASAAIAQLSNAYPNAYNILGDPGMYGIYSKYSPNSQYIDAVAPNLLSNALMGGAGGLGASIALTGMRGVADLHLPASLRTTAVLGGLALGGLYGAGKSTGQYLGGRFLPLGE